MATVAAISASTDPVQRCRLCGCKIVLGVGDDLAKGLCRDHKADPRAQSAATNGRVATRPASPRPFTPADQALVKSLHGALPAAQLLDVLNARLLADVGTAHAPYTLEQLQVEAQKHVEASATGGDWASLRYVLAAARRRGLLAEITPQIVDDFATVFQISPAQLTKLRDVIRGAQEDR